MNIPPLIPFSTINDLSVSAKRSNLTLAFLKDTGDANPRAENFFQDQVHIFQDTYF